jgi:uncharacterized protein (DUF2141 family)
MKIIIALLFLAAPMRGFADEGVTLSVTVTNIPGAQGTILIGLYESAGSFTDRPLEVSPKVAVTSTDDLTAKIENVKPGTYAIAVIQDLNGNGKLDRNFLGMPKEPLAFSVIKEIPRGKPDFAACSFEVKDKDVAMTIPLTVK